MTARGLVQEVTLSDGSARADGRAGGATLRRTRHHPSRAAFALGQHSDEILRERFALDAAAIAALRQRGIV